MEQPPVFSEEPVSPLTSARVALENFLRLSDQDTLTINRVQAQALLDTQPKLNHQILSKAAQVVRDLANRNNSMAMAGLCRTLDELAAKQIKKV